MARTRDETKVLPRSRVSKVDKIEAPNEAESLASESLYIWLMVTHSACKLQSFPR